MFIYELHCRYLYFVSVIITADNNFYFNVITINSQYKIQCSGYTQLMVRNFWLCHAGIWYQRYMIFKYKLFMSVPNLHHCFISILTNSIHTHTAKTNLNFFLKNEYAFESIHRIMTFCFTNNNIWRFNI